MIVLNRKISKFEKPKIVKVGPKFYILITMYIISKEEIYFKNKRKSKMIYIRTLINNNKIIKSPLPEDNDIIIDDFQEFNDFIISYCDLNDKEYKIFLYEENLSVIDNNIQLLNYKGNTIYVKISKENKNYNVIESNKSLSVSLNKFYNREKTKSEKEILLKTKNKNIFKSNIPIYDNIYNYNSLSSNNSFVKNNINQSQNQSIESYQEINTHKLIPLKNKLIEKKSLIKRIINNVLNNKTNSLFSQSDHFSNNFIPYRLFPKRGIFKTLKKTNSSKLFFPENKYENYFFQKSNSLKLFRLRNKSTDREIDNQLEIMRKFLLSSTTRDLKYNKIKVYNNNNQEKNIRIEYTKLLINLRQVALQFIDDMISKEILSKSPDLISIFDYDNILSKKFPFEHCKKEFIFYSYLSDYSLINNFSFINNNNSEAIIFAMKKLYEEIERIKDNIDLIEKYLIECNKKNDIFIDMIFFEVFILCSDFFNGIQNEIGNLILSVLQVNLTTKKISYSKFSEYFYFFRLSDFVSNEEKTDFIKKLLTLLEGKGIYGQKLFNDDNEIKFNFRKIFRITEKLNLEFLNEFNLSKTKKSIRKYTKIDSIYEDIINYFTYQQ